MNLKNEKQTKRAFTLVEALIVIAVIGVVAAFVIPIVVTNANKAQLVSLLQKTSNTFTNVANHAQTDTKMDSWNYNLTVEEFAKEYILPHLNVAKVCGTAGTECFAESYVANNTGKTSLDNTYYKIALTDGSAVAMKLTTGCSTENNPSECVDFIVDTNGTKKPNVWGKDVFHFQILNNFNAIVPYGTFEKYNTETNKWEFADEDTASGNCTDSDERYCALKVINDGWQMNY